MKIFITILLIVSYFKTHAQSISCLAWEYNVSQEIYTENDSSASSILDMMLTQLKTENKIYLKGDTMVLWKNMILRIKLEAFIYLEKIIIIHL